MKVLYLSYDGALDPLGRSQIVPLLEGLSGRGHSFDLVTFEKPGRWRERASREAMTRRLEEAGVRWHPLRYSKRPPGLATAWDLFRGWQRVRRLARVQEFDLVHVRSYPAAVLALRLFRRRGIPYLFDIRGFYAEERVDGGLWPEGGRLYRMTKSMEADFLRHAAGVVTLTRASVAELEKRIEAAGGTAPVQVIPTSVDLDRFEELPAPAGPFQLTYVGSLGTWYDLPAMLEFAAVVQTEDPDAQVLLLTNDPESAERSVERAGPGLDRSRVEIRSVAHEEVPRALGDAHATFFFIAPRSSKVASEATKFGESLALGLPVALNPGVGDSAGIAEAERVGVVVDPMSQEAFERAARELMALARAPDVRSRCRRVAEERYGLGSAVKSYDGLYGRIRDGGSHGRSLVVLAPYPLDRAPSQRFKFEQYYPSWREAGWRVSHRSFWDGESWNALYRRGGLGAKLMALLRGIRRRRRDVEAALGADLVYLHLEAVPVGPPSLERKLARSGVPLVYDIDDLVHLPHASAANRFMRWLRRPGKILEIMALADHVVVCTRRLRDIAAAYNDRVTNISSTIDSGRYRPRPHRERTRDVVVGWSGSHSTSPYLHLLDEVLRELQRREGIRIRVIGDASFSIDGVDVEAMAWRAESEVEDLSAIDVGVYPLPHEEWVLGKSGLKALQYMALEIPTVAERIGTNTEIIQDGDNGLMAGTEDEWLEALRRLVRDPGLRRRLGQQARRTVVERYSVEANTETYLGVLRQASQIRD